MANNGIEKISYSQVRASADSLNTSASKLKGILDGVKQKMNVVGNEATWKSDAASQFKKQFDELAGNFEKFETAIRNYSGFLKQTVDTYEAADKAIKAKADELL